MTIIAKDGPVTESVVDAHVTTANLLRAIARAQEVRPHPDGMHGRDRKAVTSVIEMRCPSSSVGGL